MFRDSPYIEKNWNIYYFSERLIGNLIAAYI